MQGIRRLHIWGRKYEGKRPLAEPQSSDIILFTLLRVPAAPERLIWPHIPRPKDFQFKSQPCARSHSQKTYFVRRTFIFPPEEET